MLELQYWTWWSGSSPSLVSVISGAAAALARRVHSVFSIWQNMQQHDLHKSHPLLAAAAARDKDIRDGSDMGQTWIHNLQTSSGLVLGIVWFCCLVHFTNAKIELQSSCLLNRRKIALELSCQPRPIPYILRKHKKTQKGTTSGVCQKTEVSQITFLCWYVLWL